jgi:uncharacterized protein YndB with AHSA1/START domain
MTGFTLTRSIAAEPQRVWDAFTNADEYAAWIWPVDWHTECSIDLRTGGEFRVASEQIGLSIRGTYVEIDPITRLVMNWLPTGSTDQTVLTISIEPSATGTELILTHENFADDKSRAEHETGWTDCLSRLPLYLGAAA